jgi:methyltransferase (TIGR00027 family)
MQQGKPSRTGELTAIMRAIHQTADEEPKILADSIAPCLVDTTGADEWLTPILRHPFAKQWRAGFLVRSRYAEDCLAEWVVRGGRQYAILGAGLDTFAFRQPAWAKALSIYEIDHPVTQRWKRDRLAAMGIAIPPNLTFVPVDFERASFADALRVTNFDSNSKTLFSWLGVTQYLTRNAISATLRLVLSLPRSCEVVFSFVLPSETLPKGEAEARLMAAQTSAQIGEPYLTAFLADELRVQLRAMGFSEVIHLTPEMVRERYLKNRSDGLKARFGEQLMRAIV